MFSGLCGNWDFKNHLKVTGEPNWLNPASLMKSTSTPAVLIIMCVHCAKGTFLLEIFTTTCANVVWWPLNVVSNVFIFYIFWYFVVSKTIY